MKDHDFTAVQMYWKPALLKLTQIPNPDMDEGKTTTCYIDPQAITAINRAMTGFNKEKTEYGAPEHHPRIACTSVTVSTHLGLYVTETPETVAAMRDKALGHEPPPSSVQQLKAVE